MFEEMSLSSLAFDMYSGEPLVLLKDPTKNNSFLVSGNNQDIRYLMAEFSGRTPDASSPYSLIFSLLLSLACNITRLEIIHNSNNIPTGQIHIINKEKEFIQECRPIDVVLISNKLTMPIWVLKDLLNQPKTFSLQDSTQFEPSPSFEKEIFPFEPTNDKKILM